MKLGRVISAAAIAATLLAATLPVLFAMPAIAQQGTAKTIITVLPKKSELQPSIEPQNVKVKIAGKSVETQSVTPLRGDRAGLELVILIDSGVRTSLGQQLSEISDFIKSLPPTTQVAVAYMVNGRAVFEQPFSADKDQAVRSLHIPAGGVGSSASPYFCISDVAKNWPSRNPLNRRQLIVITDGIDPYEVRFDPSDPYVHAATNDAIRAGITVDALYWHNRGRASRVGWLASGGQNLLTQLTEDTGGRLYYQGLGNPVSFVPYFREISRNLDNQYELSFTAPARNKTSVESLNVKLQVPNVKLIAPHLVAVPGK
ncbi:MAG: hypothetical protein ACRD3F_12390 [Acidobacteriaceae bacterium]